MKKNMMMRLSIFLVLGILLTTCVISGTFAKYTTSNNGSDSAKVAAWGLTIDVENSETLFDDSKTGNEVSAVVKANDLAAPGTYQKLTTVSLSGTPEVKYSIKVDVNVELNNWVVDSLVYCPLVFTVAGTELKIDATNTTTEELEAAIEEAIIKQILGNDAAITAPADATKGSTSTKVNNAGVATSVSEFVVDWTWAFDGNNANDTALGNASEKATIGFTLVITADQLDA